MQRNRRLRKIKDKIKNEGWEEEIFDRSYIVRSTSLVLGQSKAIYERNIRWENRSESCRKICEEKIRERVEFALVVDKPEGCRGTWF